MPIIKVKMGTEKGRIYEISEKPLTMGRDASESIQIMDHGVSRQHAEVFKIGEMYFIRDLGSTNGTFVNDVKINEELLRAGDQIRIGSTVLVFEDVAHLMQEAESQVDYEAKEEADASPSTTLELRLDKEHELREKVKSIGKEVDSRNLMLLYEIAKIIGSERELQGLLNRSLNMLVDAVDADAGYIFLLEKGTEKLVPRANVDKGKGGEAKVSRTILKRVVQYPRSVLTSDAAMDDRFTASTSIVMKKIKSVICAPLVSMDRIAGAVYLHSAKQLKTFSSEDLELATAISIQLGMALTGFLAADRLRKMLAGVAKTLVAAAEMRDPNMEGHSERVANYSVAIAGQLKMSKPEISRIQLAALLHDVGKLGTTLANVPGVDAEKKKEEHVLIAEKFLANLPGFEDIVHMVKLHHEKLDGTGYPYRVEGDAIPIGAQIIAVADTFDTMANFGGVSGRSLTVKEILLDIGKMGGKQYDDKVIQALLVCHRNRTLFEPASPFEE
ncbi:MAG: FHA domain-containing protein [Planctomycetota bacterium]|nr:FHA domain-containing protein [Planctomycetota bacterium]